MQVLIVGAGLGGLCLAHGLQKAGIDVQIFERQEHESESRAGYGIHIDGNGRRALKSCLPAANWNQFAAKSKPSGTQMFFRDTDLHILAERDDSKVSGAPTTDIERRGISRVELRRILLDGLSDGKSARVHWNKTFSSLSRLSNGRVCIKFTDDTTAEGDCLIGADGAQSAVRKQYLPHIQRLDLGIHAIAGRCSLGDDQRDAVPADLINGSLNNIVPHGKGWMFVSAWDLPSTLDACDNSKMTSHVVWAYVVPAADNLSAISSYQPSQLKDLVLDGIKDWSSGLNFLVKSSDLSGITCIPLKSMPFLEAWTPSNITLIGDSIHNMTPMAGVGANTALRDAELLTELLKKAAAGETSTTEAISEYESKMRVYANEAVGLSTQNAINASSAQGIQRWMFRMVLKAAQASPFIMRKTLGKNTIKVANSLQVN